LIFNKDSKIKAAFNIIKEELNEHLDSINENTEELQLLHNLYLELESRIDRIEDRLSKIQLMIEDFMHPKLNTNEEAVFLELYTNEASPLSYADLGLKLGMPELVVRKTIASLIKKGIEIDVVMIDNKPFFRLAKSSRERQAKENILKLKKTIK